MSLPTITFLYITAGEGSTGTSGQELADYWTTNFNLIKTLLVSLDEDLQGKVSSDDIVSLKVEDNVAYYTTDGETWVSLGPAFANISGAVEDNAALVEKFSKYTTVANYNNAVTRISTLESTVTIIQSDLDNLEDTVDTIYSQINGASTGILVRLAALEDEIDDKITSTTVMAIRQTSSTYEVDGEEVTEYWLQYTTDGENWIDINAASTVEWSNIIGDITENEALMNQIDILNDAITNNYTNITNLQSDMNNAQSDITNNYTNISNLQSDVSNIQSNMSNIENNVSDLGDQVSDAVADISNIYNITNNLEAEVENIASNITVTSITSSNYENLSSIDSNTIYMVTDLYQ